MGQTATFSVVASGGVPTSLTYQWRKGSVNVSGATSASYTTPPTVIGDNGTVFSVVVSNAAGTVTSANATLTVTVGVPVVTTTAVTGITVLSANSGGNVTSDSGAAVASRGVCWSTTPNPTTANSKTVDGTGTGTFVSSLTALTTSTTYHVRAYATNSVGTAYGSSVSFITPGPTVRSLLIKPPPFDAAAWQNDAAYRMAYLADNYPGRVWQTAAGSVGTPTLEIQGENQVTVASGATVILRVRGAPGSSITFALNGPGRLLESQLNVATILADGNGDAQVTYSASEGGGRIPIVVGSPLSVGQVRFLVEVL